MKVAATSWGALGQSHSLPPSAGYPSTTVIFSTDHGKAEENPEEGSPWVVLLCDGRGVLAFCRGRPTLPHQLGAGWSGGSRTLNHIVWPLLHTRPCSQSSWGPPEMRVISFPSHMQKQGSERLSDLAEVTQLGAKVDMEPKSKKSVH